MEPTLTSRKGLDNTYGVFVYSESGNAVYRKSDAIKVYKELWRAKRYADELNLCNNVHVVRTMEYIVR